MTLDVTCVHLIAGGAGGTAGAIMTCPLEVVKTRLQSSMANFSSPQVYVTRVQTVSHHPIVNLSTCTGSVQAPLTVTASVARHSKPSLGLLHCLRHIIQVEGPRALFKGLGPNLIGVAPSRAIYFYSYAQAKSFCNRLTFLKPDSPIVHILAASSAGFSACTCTNPIWLIKTRLQLDQKAHSSLTTSQCIKNIYQTTGLKGFYKGITASYFGISETVIHFVIYEAVKAKLATIGGSSPSDEKSVLDFTQYMIAGAISKTCASSLAYPHEVVRTRLREEGAKYKGFFQTLRKVFHEEGYRGLYRGLFTQLVRQIPNTAIMMSTYEAMVYLLSPAVVESEVDDFD